MPDESYYKERGEEKRWPKILLIILGVLALALIIFLLVKGCTGNEISGDMENDLLNAGKKYYSIDETLLPQASGECKTVTLGTLVEEELLNNNNYSKCNKDKTYVKVCKLESGSYHYLPVMQCGSTLADDNFTNWIEGKESDLVKDKSDVRFTFKGEALEVSKENLTTEEEGWADEIKGLNYKTISSTTYYRYRDLVYKWNITSKEYYTSSGYITKPADGYLSDDVTTGYKWYTNKTTTVASQNPVYAKPFQLLCYDSSVQKAIKKNVWKDGEPQTCEDYGLESSFTYEGKEYKNGRTYTCGDPTSGSATALASGKASTVCAASCEQGTLSSDKKTCSYTTKNYYEGYYLTAPASGAIKDESTAAQVSNKWYKSVTKVTDKYYATAPESGATKAGQGVWGSWSNYQTTQPKAYTGTRQIESRVKVKYQKITEVDGAEVWTPITNGYVSESELISAFQNANYKVNTLKEIEDANDLRYSIKLEYRNRKN